MRFATWLVLPLSLAACSSLQPLDTSSNDSGSDTSSDTSSTDTGTDSGDTGVDTSGNCTFAIPSDALVGNVDLVVDQPDQVVWGCKSHNFSITAPRTILFLERAADGVLNTTDTVVYMKSGSRLALFQDSNEIWLEDERDVDDQSGGTNQFTLCTTLTFDYTNAPSAHQGCP